MIDYDIIKNKSIALLVWNTEKKNDAHVYRGCIVQKDENYYFVNDAKNWRLQLDEEQYGKLKELAEDVKSILLDADYGIPMYMAGLPEEDKENLISTGMEWHE